MSGTYNWCNMPHVRPQEYPQANSSYSLQYVELIHRHHKRTPYASNTFPRESYAWSCSDEGLFYSGAPLPTDGANHSANTYWSVYTSPSNPLAPPGFNGTCQFPQITRDGLDDSHQHGADLFAVYHGLLNFIPSTYDPKDVTFRVTNNVITSQVASMVTSGMYPTLSDTHSPTALLIQPSAIDSLEPGYSCPSASSLQRSYSISASPSSPWSLHLNLSAPLFSALDSISGINASDASWHTSWDHYYDNLSARLCHSKPLPCDLASNTRCISQTQADTVFRLGQWEYSHLYRDAPLSLRASTAAYGIFIAELAQNLRDVVAGIAGPRYRHNIAHDGSVARVLSLLQVDVMVWPGMGAEVVFELFTRVGDGVWVLRVLWGGRVLTSSSPVLGILDMVELETVLGYFDGLVGVGAEKVPGLCAA